MKILIINGAPRVGKNTFISFLNEITKNKVFAYSSIDWVKNVASNYLEWDGKKDEKGRAFISEIKDACIKYADIPFKKVILEIHKAELSHKYNFFCTNIREPEEIKKLISWCLINKYECKTIWIRRKESELAAEKFTNTGDSNYCNYSYNITLKNNSTLENFKKIIKNLYKEL